MNRSRIRPGARRAWRAVLPAAAAVLTAAAAFAAEGEGHGGGTGVPWAEIVKQAINFAILAGALVFLLRKPVSAYLKERTELLRKSIDDAAKARAEAARKLAAVEERTARLADEIAQMTERMESEGKAEAQALHETATAEIARLRSQAEFAAEQEVKKARQELQQEASALSAKAAQDLVRKALSPEDQERLVRENIQEIERVVR